MTELDELEQLVGNLENIEAFGIEPDFSSLGLEPADVLGFKSEEALENALELLTKEVIFDRYRLYLTAYKNTAA